MSTLAAGVKGLAGLNLPAGLKRAVDDDCWGRASAALEARACTPALLYVYTIRASLKGLYEDVPFAWHPLMPDAKL